MQKYYIYILYSDSTDKFYTGASSDIDKRLQRHNAGATKSTKNGRPWKIVYSEEFNTNKEALNRERYIKKQKSRSFITKLIESAKQERASRLLSERSCVPRNKIGQVLCLPYKNQRLTEIRDFFVL